MKAEQLEAGEANSKHSTSSSTQRVLLVNRGLSVMDLVLRIIAAVGSLGSAVAMGTTDQTLPSFIQFIQFNAQYNDTPMFTFFVIANSIVCAYLGLSLHMSIFHIIRSSAAINSRIILVIFDTVMMALLTAGTSAAAAIVYLAHNGNASANWFAFCQHFNSFCERTSGSLIGSFGGMLVFMLRANH
ncbi:casparian strip membrane protein 1-like [Juglans microcarpa x Juglans regia]|uniref:casparian strip membrane protein 1-like n=1 Tax=Juglans microcarpa x Juglans regia TaxID=2249226 RepID=UPI001B7F6660|nr:casparian strip membrane protein 1-like [Juglans microcarpa x Juglans regia]